MAYITLPDSHWYRTNPIPVNSDKTFNKEIFKEGLRLGTSQAENILSMLVTEAVQSGFLPNQNLMQQVKKKNISDTVRRVYARKRNLYGWGAINDELVKDYLLHGIVHKWVQKSAIGAPSPLPNARLNSSGAGPVHASPPCRASHSKLTDRSIPHDENLGNVSEKSSNSSQVESASPIALRKRTRNSRDGDDLSDAEAEMSRAKKTRTQVTKIDLSKDEPTLRQKLEILRDNLRKDETDKRKELNDKVKELGHVEGMLRDLVQEEGELAEVEDKVNKTREKAAAMYAASVAGRAESKK